MADATITKAFRRFFTEAEVEEAYRAAMAAMIERHTEVVVTSAQFGGDNGAGQIVGDPRVVMECCEVVLAEYEAEASAGCGAVPVDALPGTSHVDFSGTRFET